MIPLKDNIPTQRFPVVTVVLIAINVAAFVWQMTKEGLTAACEYGAIPARITDPGAEIGAACGTDLAPWWLTLLTAMFLHGDLLHIGFNMLFLWIFGNNIEDRLGRGRFLLFYLLAGLTATYAQAAIDPDSVIPTIGASGAIAGVLGAYALLYPRARVLSLVIIIFFVTLVEVPAMLLLGIWLLLQFLPAVGQLATPEVAGQGGVAYLAHIGGFVFGLLTIKLWLRRRDESGPSLGSYA